MNITRVPIFCSLPNRHERAEYRHLGKAALCDMYCTVGAPGDGPILRLFREAVDWLFREAVD